MSVLRFMQSVSLEDLIRWSGSTAAIIGAVIVAPLAPLNLARAVRGPSAARLHACSTGSGSCSAVAARCTF